MPDLDEPETNVDRTAPDMMDEVEPTPLNLPLSGGDLSASPDKVRFGGVGKQMQMSWEECR